MYKSAKSKTSIVRIRKRRIIFVSIFSVFMLTIICLALGFTREDKKIELNGGYDLEKTINISAMKFQMDSTDMTAKFIGLDHTQVISPKDYFVDTLMIPQTVGTSNEYTVTGIEITNSANLLTTDFGYLVKGVTAIVLPDSIETISAAAFYGAESLVYYKAPFVGLQKGNVGRDSSMGSVFGSTQYGTSVLVPWFNVVTGASEENQPADVFWQIPNQFREVVITQETVLGNRTFFSIKSLVSVQLPNSCLKFGDSVFNSCVNLTTVKMPEELSVYGTATFGACSKLTTLTLPRNIKAINRATFFQCVSLASIVIPNTVTEISEGAFNGCSQITSFTLPSGLKTIGNEAFRDCSSVGAFEIPKKVETIGKSAFNGCSSLSSISLPFIGACAGNSGTPESLFGYVFGTFGDESVTTSGSYIAVQRFGTGKDDFQTFYIPSSLSIISITEETYVGKGALQNLKVKAITITNSVMHIEGGSLNGCSKLESLSVPFIGESVNASGAKGALGYIFGTDAYVGGYSTYQVYGTYIIPTSLRVFQVTNQQVLRTYAFYNCMYLTDIIIDDSLQYAQAEVFYNCGKLVNLSIPFVGPERGVFYDRWWWGPDNNIRNTMAWVFSSTNSGDTYENRAAYKYYVRYIPNSLASIKITDEYTVANYSFRDFRSLKSIEISDNTTSIAWGCMSGCSSLEEIIVPFIGANRNANAYSSSSYVLGYFFGSSHYANTYGVSQAGEYFYIPQNLKRVQFGDVSTSISNFAFAGCSSLESIKSNASIIQLGSYAFSDCKKLAILQLPNASYTRVGDYAFNNCLSVGSIDAFIPQTVKYIGAYAFNNTSISSIDFTRYETIGNYAFANCLQLTDATLTSNITSLGSGVFAGCKYLATVQLAGKVSPYLFKDCVSLQSIDFTGITEIPEGIFSGCTNLKSYDARNNTGFLQDTGTTSIGSYAFYNCRSLSYYNFTIPNSYIGKWAFSGCQGLEYVTIPRNTLKIENDVFTNCNKDFYINVYYEEVDWPKTWVENWNCFYPVYVIGVQDSSAYIYEYDSNLKGYIIIGVNPDVELSGKIVLPATHDGLKVYGVGANALVNATAVTDIILGQNIKQIATGAFKTGNPLNIYSQDNKTADCSYIGNEASFITSGKVYYKELWQLVNNVPKLNLSTLVFELSAVKYEYDGIAKKPTLSSVNSQAVIVGNGITDTFDPADFSLGYTNNILAGMASITFTSSDTKLVGNATRNFEISKKVLYLFGEPTNPDLINTTYNGKLWTFSTWSNANIINLDDISGLTFTGTIATWLPNAGTYMLPSDFVWTNGWNVYKNGAKITDNFAVYIGATVEIDKCTITLQWDSDVMDGDTYLYPYNSSMRKPIAVGVNSDGQKMNANIQVEVLNNIIYPGTNSTAKVTSYDTNNFWIERTVPQTIKFAIVKAIITIKININPYTLQESENCWTFNDWTNSEKVSISGLGENSSIDGSLVTNNYLEGDYTSTNNQISWLNDTYKISSIINGVEVAENAYYDIVLDAFVKIAFPEFQYEYKIDEEKVSPSNDGLVTYKTDGATHTFKIVITNTNNSNILYTYGSSTDVTTAFTFKELNADGYVIDVKVTKDKFKAHQQSITLSIIKSDIVFDTLDKQYDRIAVDPDSKVLKKASGQIITYSFYLQSDINFTTKINAPSEPGLYKVRAVAAETDYFNALDEVIRFKITKRKITISVQGEHFWNGSVWTKTIDSSVLSSSGQLLENDVFHGTIMTKNASIGTYDSKINGDFVWRDGGQFHVYNGAVDNTKYYEIELQGVYTIKSKLMSVTSQGVADAFYTGQFYSISVSVQDPNSRYTIYYSETQLTADNDPDNPSAQVGTGDWSIVPFFYYQPGVYTVFFKVVAENYETYYGSETITIKKLEIEYQCDETQTVSYDGYGHSVDINIVKPWNVKILYSVAGSAPSTTIPVFVAEGEYIVNITLSCDNYNSKEISVRFIIESGSNTLQGLVSVSGYLGSYDANYHGPTYTIDPSITIYEVFYSSDYTNNDLTATWETSRPMFIDTGIYSVSVKIMVKGYAPYIETVNIEINKLTFANVSVTGFDSFYDGKSHGAEITGLDNYTDYTVRYSSNKHCVDDASLYTITPIKHKNVGSYLLYVSITAENYEELFTTVQVIIKKVVVTADFVTDEVEYCGGPIPDIKLETLHDGNRIYTYFVANSNMNSYFPTPISNPSELGTYYVKVKLLESQNCAPLEVSGYFKIVPKVLTVDYKNKVEYTGLEQYPYFTINTGTSDELYILYELVGSTKPIGIGTYTLNLSFTPSNPNYVLDSYTAEYEITQRKLSMTIEESFDYVNSSTLWTKNSGFEDYALNLLPGDRLVANMTTSSGIRGDYFFSSNNSGSWANKVIVNATVMRSVSGTDVDVTAYYAFDFEIIIHIVFPKLTVSVENFEGVYDGLPHGVTINIPSNVVQAIVFYSASPDFNPQFTSLTYTNVGEYKIYYKVVANDYEPFIGEATITIIKGELDIIVNPLDATYANMAYNATFNVNNVANFIAAGEIRYYRKSDITLKKLASLYKNLSPDNPLYSFYENALTGMTNAGDYYAVVYFEEANNWLESFGIGEVTIKQKGVNITFNSPITLTKSYCNQKIIIPLGGVTINTADLILGHTVTSPLVDSSIRTSSPDAKDTFYENDGDFEFDDIFISNSNGENVSSNYYPITSGLKVKISRINVGYFTAEEWTIVKYTGRNPLPKTYTDSDGQIQYTYYKIDDNGNYLDPNPIIDPTNVGKYEVIMTISQGVNYLPYNTPVIGKVEVVPSAIDAIWEEMEQTYTGLDLNPKAHIIDVFGNRIELTVAFISQQDYIAGDYEVSAILNDPNYILQNNSAIFTIKKVSYDVFIDEKAEFLDKKWEKEFTTSDFENFLLGHNLFHKDSGNNLLDKAILSTKTQSAGIYNKINQFDWNYVVMNNGKDVSNSFEFKFTIKVVITKAEIDFEVADYEVTYDGFQHGLIIKVLNPASYVINYSADGTDFSHAEEYFKYRDVGIYTVYFQIVSDGCNTVSGSATITILQKPANISFTTGIDKIYDGIAVDKGKLSYSVECNGGKDAVVFTYYDALTNTVLNGAPMNAGSYYILVTSSADIGDISKLNYSKLEARVYFKISPRPLNLNITDTKIVTTTTNGELWTKTDTISNGSNIIEMDYFNYTISRALTTGTYKYAGTLNYEGQTDVSGLPIGSKTIFDGFTITWDVENRSTPNDYRKIGFNYEININLNVTVRYANMQVSSTNETFEYDGSSHGPNITITDPSLDVVNIMYGWDLNSINQSNLTVSDPGKWVIYYRISATNYEDYVGFVEITINYKVRNALSADSLDKEYDGLSAGIPNVTFDDSTDLPNQSTWTIKFFKNSMGDALSEAINYGDYGYTITVPRSTYYEETIIKGTFKITKRTITVGSDGTAITKVFDNNSWTTDIFNANGLETLGLVSGDTLIGTISTNDVIVGTYSSSAKTINWLNGFKVMNNGVDLTNNYKVSLSLTMEIIPGEIDVDVTAVNTFYDGEYKYVKVQVNMPVQGYTIYYSKDNINWTTEKIGFNTTGSHDIFVKITADNYNDKIVPSRVEINTGATTMVIPDISKVYDAIFVSNPFVTTNSDCDRGMFIYEYEQFIGGSFVTMGSVRPINVGRYKVKVTIPSTSSYVGKQEEKEFSITPFVQSVSWGGSSFVYNGLNQQPVANYTTFQNQVLDIKYTISILNGLGDQYSIGVGTYRVNAAILNNPNYEFKVDTVNCDYEITPRPISINFNTSKNYTGNKFIFMPTTDFTVNNLVNFHLFNGKLESTFVNIGTYKGLDKFVWVDGFDDSYIIYDAANSDVTANYLLTTNITVTVDNNRLEVTAIGYKGVYDGLNHTIDVKANILGQCTYTYSTSSNGNYSSSPIPRVNVGIYTIYYMVESFGYTTVKGSAVIEITKAPTTLLVDDMDLSKIYDGIEVSNPTVSYNGTQRDDKLTYQYYKYNATSTAGDHYETVAIGNTANAGKYKLVISMADTGNYGSDEVIIEFTITARKITISLRNQSMIYNGAQWNYALTNSNIVNIVNGHTFNGTVQTKFVDAKFYKLAEDFTWHNEYKLLDANNVVVTQNYEVILDLEVTIEKAEIIYTAADYQAIWNGQPHTISITVANPLAGYTISYSADGITYTQNEIFKQTGITTVYFKIEADNYVTVISSKQIIISPIPPNNSQVSHPGDKEYDGLVYTTPTVTTESTGVRTIKYYLASDTAKLHPLATTPINAGYYFYEFTVDSDGIYEAFSVINGFQIKPKQIILNWTVTTFVYDGTAHSPVAVALDINSNNLTVTVVGGAILAGKHNATASITDTNYVLATNTVEFTITKGQVAPPVFDPAMSFIFGEEIIIKDVNGSIYVLDEDGNVVEIQYIDGTIDTNPQLKFTIKVDSNLNVGTRKFILILNSPDNEEWAGLSTSANQEYEYRITELELLEIELKIIVTPYINMYTGLAIEPIVTITIIGGKELVLNTDYKKLYSDNINAGTGTVKLTGMGNYSFEIFKSFIIENAIPETILLKDDSKIQFVEVVMDFDLYSVAHNVITSKIAYQTDVVLGHLYQETLISDILLQIANDLTKIKVFDIDGNLVDPGDYEALYFGTGMSIKLYDDSDVEIDSIQGLLFGDLNGDGMIDVFDSREMTKIMNYDVDYSYESIKYKAAQLNSELEVSIFDKRKITSHQNYELDINEDYI